MGGRGRENNGGKLVREMGKGEKRRELERGMGKSEKWRESGGRNGKGKTKE